MNRLVMVGVVFLSTLAIGSMTLGWGLTLLIPVGLVLSVVVLLGESATQRDDVSATGYAGSTASLIQAFAVVLVIWGIWRYVDEPVAWATENWWLGVLAIVGLFSFWYLQQRRQVASASTAINRTQRTAKRTVSSWTELLTGIAVLALTGVFAMLTGVLDALAPYAGELTYLGTVFLGYLQLGGEWDSQLAAFIPSLGPMEWVGITLFLGGMALYIRHQA